jgi:hypothetical protein
MPADETRNTENLNNNTNNNTETTETLADRFARNSSPGSNLDQICASLSIQPQTLIDTARVHQPLHRLLRAHTITAFLLLIDSYRQIAADAAKSDDPGARAHAALDLQRIMRTAADLPQTFDALLPEPPPEDAKPETDEDRYCASNAEYRDENGVPIDMNHPTLINAAIDAMIEARRTLERAAKERLYAEKVARLSRLDAEAAAAAESQPRPGGSNVNYEIDFPTDPEPEPEPDLELDLDPRTVTESERNTIRKIYLRHFHPAPPASPPPSVGKKYGPSNGRSPERH